LWKSHPIGLLPHKKPDRTDEERGRLTRAVFKSMNMSHPDIYDEKRRGIDGKENKRATRITTTFGALKEK
jgi:hypothetical protein